MRKMLILALFLAVSGLIIAGCQTSTVNDRTSVDTGKVDCTKTEEYTVQVPYNETEFYYVKEGVGRPHCAEDTYTDFSVDVASLGKRCEIKVKNTGNITGDWTIKAKFITTNSGGGPESDPQTKEIQPGETAIFVYQYDQSDTPMDCQHINVKVPSVEVCKYTFYQDVKKSRTVTNLKEETRTREVPC